MMGPVPSNDEESPRMVRRAVELIEQAPAEALHSKLLESLVQAGEGAEQHGASDASQTIAFAYKLAVELGAKLSLLSQDDLSWRRSVAALLLGDEDQPIRH